jgi:hypothetical protein
MSIVVPKLPNVTLGKMGKQCLTFFFNYYNISLYSNRFILQKGDSS